MSDNDDCFSSIDSDLSKLADKEEQEVYLGKDGDAFDAKNVFTAQEFDGTAPFEEMKKKMVAITDDRRVFKLNLNTNPENKDVVLPRKCSVTIHYELSIEGQDEPFDSTFVRGVPEKFKLDSNANDSLLPGIEIGLRTMKLGDTSVFLISPEYAFGKHGFPPRIPENREILAVVKLFRFVPEGEAERLLEMEYTARSCLPLSEILTAVNAEHQTGNENFKEEEFELALNNYNFAIKLIKERKDERTAEMECIEEKLYLNKAYCLLQMDNPQKAIDFCQLAIDLNNKSVKAYYRMGKAYLELKMLNEAKEAFSTAHALMPSESFILQEIIKLDKQLQENNMADVALCKKMFKNVNIIEKEKDDKFKDTEIFKSLEDFKNDPDCKEMVLPFNQFQGKLNLLEDCAKELNLNIRFSNNSREIGQRIYISKKTA